MSVSVRLAAYLRTFADESEAGPMAAYMKNHFPFLGLKAPRRAELTRQFWKENGLPGDSDFRLIVRDLWAMPEREFQYAAMDLLERKRKSLGPDDIVVLQELIVTKSWWDTIDFLASHSVGGVFARFPELIPGYTDKWIRSDNMWLQRTALLFQLGYKDNTDKTLLFRLIEQCRTSDQFFIRKAIGWALREYSKTDSDAVVGFVRKTGLSPLSVREALKVVENKGKRAEKGLASDAL